MPVSKKRKPKSKRNVKHQCMTANSMDILNNPNTRILDMNDAPDEVKLSAKIITLIEPWMGDFPIETLADCAALAWNACVSGEDDYSSVDFLSNSITTYTKAEQIALIEQLKAKKEKLFPTDLRSIVRIQVIMDEYGDPRINVASELKPMDLLKILEQLRDDIE